MVTTSGSTAFLFLLLLLLLLLSSPFYDSLLDRQLRQRTRTRAPDVPQRNLSILLWHWPFGLSSRLSGDRCSEMFHVRRCSLSDDASTFSSADVVVFHHQELSSGSSSLPLHLDRPASQRWVWLSMEPPANIQNLRPLDGLFNWTMSYRRDADIRVPYGETVLGGDGFKASPNRSCLVSWVVSRYRAQQARARVYQSLKDFIPIEVYGRWTGRPLPKRKLLPTIGRCFFYLSFENSQEKDYISEKFWRNAFQAGAVPVVLGPSRSTYETLAPPGSFIHVDDFGSSAELAAYLKVVAADRQNYEEFFKWHRTHRIKTYTDWRERLCQICVQYQSLPARKVYQNLESWVYG